MYSIILCFIVASLPIIGAENSTTEFTQTCPQNEVHSKCGNHGCQNTCSRPDTAVRCRPICTPGCVCQQGMFRNTKGNCVSPPECDTCAENETFVACGNTGCVNTCKEPNLQATCRPERCIAGCVCKPGFLRNNERKCVKPVECVTECNGDPNAVYDLCGDPCGKTCRNMAANCADDTCIQGGGCKCKKGYVKNDEGKCVPLEQCKLCEGENEELDCRYAPEITCATVNNTVTSERFCINKCYCKEGYARDDRGVCVSIDDCGHRQCKNDPNAIVVPCGDPCPVTCENRDNQLPRPCPRICLFDGCKCKPGYVQGPEGKCILPSECPKELCGNNEIWDKCPDECQATCDSFATGRPSCDKREELCKPGCRCKQMFVRNQKGECVRPHQCCQSRYSKMVRDPNPCPGGTCQSPHFERCQGPSNVLFGCQCMPGFVKKDETNPKCVPIASCYRIN